MSGTRRKFCVRSKRKPNIDNRITKDDLNILVDSTKNDLTDKNNSRNIMLAVRKKSSKLHSLAECDRS